MFAKSSSKVYDESNNGKSRVFTDKEYAVQIGGVNNSCRLSTEWISSDLDPKTTSANYLLALIAIVNKFYSNVIRIFEDSGKWYIE